MDEARRYVGIDVAKVTLDVFIRPTGAVFSVTNEERGIQQLCRELEPADFVILEELVVWRCPSPAPWRQPGSRLR